MTAVQKLDFYATPPHNCNYLPGREAVTLFADPLLSKNTRMYAALADCGFRRSGKHLYVPHCSACSACVPVRIPVAEFRPSRSQLRTRKRNARLSIERHPATFKPEHFALYQRYLECRHPDGGMNNPSQENYLDFLTASWSDTYFYEMRDADVLVCVAVIDLLTNAMSAIYTFFEPDYARHSLGKFAILLEIEETKRLGLDWLYLGYWIKACQKMNYKNEYQPLEYYIDNEWQRQQPLSLPADLVSVSP